MNSLIAILTLVICGGSMFLAPAEAPAALALCIVTSLPTIFFLARRKEDRAFLLRVFILGILIRIAVGTLIYIGHYEEEFFGGDAITYDLYGGSLLAGWHGDKYHLGRYQNFVASGASAWGMLYLVAGSLRIGRSKYVCDPTDQCFGWLNDGDNCLQLCRPPLQQPTSLAFGGPSNLLFPIVSFVVVSSFERRDHCSGIGACNLLHTTIDGEDYHRACARDDYLLVDAFDAALLHVLHDGRRSWR